MTSKSVDVKIIPGKPGERTKVVRKRTYRAKNKALAASRHVKAWVKKAREIYTARAASWSEQAEKKNPRG